ncbi:hypothetical protein Brsp05_03278 [Brucella sp. NBRC 12953]
MLPVLAVLSQTILFGNLAIFPYSIEPNHGSRVVNLSLTIMEIAMLFYSKIETGIAAAFLVLIPLMLYVV